MRKSCSDTIEGFFSLSAMQHNEKFKIGKFSCQLRLNYN